MKKVLIIANMLFASATVFGMQGRYQYSDEAYDAYQMDLFIRGLSKTGVVKYEEAKSNFSENVNFQFPDGNTLLMYAVFAGKVDIMDILIRNYGVDLNIRNKQEDTALMQSVFHNNYEMAKLLIDNGADPNLRYQGGTTALMISVIERNAEITKLLLSEGNKDLVNLQDDLFKTALMFAVWQNYEDMVEILLEEGKAKMNEQSKEGDTALIMGAYLGNKAITDLLLQYGADVNVENFDKENALTAALYQGNEDIALDLLENGADYTKQDNSGKTALWKAVKVNSLKTVEFIMRDIEQKRNKLISAFIKSVESSFNEYKEFVNSFNEYKKAVISLDAQDQKHKFTALINAIYLGQKEMALLMLGQYDIQVNQKDVFGYSALWHAVSEGYETIIEALLKKYDKSMLIAEIDKPDLFGNTLWNTVVSQGNNKIIRLFLEKLDGDKTKENQVETQKKESHKRVNVVVQKKMIEQPIAQEKPTDRTEMVNRLFIESIKEGRISDAEDFLREEDGNGDRIVRKDCINDALMIASENGNLGIVKQLLINHDADINYKDKEKNTPLILAAKNGQYHVIPTLLKYGAAINAQNEKKESAIIVAATNARVETVRMLLKKYDGVGKKVKDFDKNKAQKRVKTIKKRLEQELKKKKFEKDDDSRIGDYETIMNLLSNEQTNQNENGQFVMSMKEKDIFWPMFFSNRSKKQMESLEKDDPITFNRMKDSIYQVSMDPFNISDEMLESGFYVKKVGDHRLVYYVDGEKVDIVSCKGHYEDNINRKSRKEVLSGVLFSHQWRDEKFVK